MHDTEVKKMRTDRQNRALHLFFTQLADLLNEVGLDMRKTLKPEVEIPWSGSTIKEYVWRPIMRIMTGKESTKEMTTDEVDKILSVVSGLISKKGLSVPFPSIETMMDKLRREEVV